jgi:hypothetical protein
MAKSAPALRAARFRHTPNHQSSQVITVDRHSCSGIRFGAPQWLRTSLDICAAAVAACHRA